MRLNGRRRDRALANNIMVFLGTIILGFLLAMVLEPASTEMIDLAATQTSRESATQGQNYVRYAWQSAHLLVIGFGVVQLIVAAVAEGRTP